MRPQTGDTSFSDSYFVGIADEISNIKFIEDFDKIVNFMLAVGHV